MHLCGGDVHTYNYILFLCKYTVQGAFFLNIHCSMAKHSKMWYLCGLAHQGFASFSNCSHKALWFLFDIFLYQSRISSIYVCILYCIYFLLHILGWSTWMEFWLVRTLGQGLLIVGFRFCGIIHYLCKEKETYLFWLVDLLIPHSL